MGHVAMGTGRSLRLMQLSVYWEKDIQIREGGEG